MARFSRSGSFVLSVVLACLVTLASRADESGGAVEANLDLWLNSAPVDLLISEIGEITGREVTIDGDLSGVVSGRYTGSVQSILDAVAREHPVLLDIDDATINAVPAAKRTVSSIVADEAPLNAAARESVTAGMLGGNSVEFIDNEILVSGHPRFVNRAARQLSAALADQGQLVNSAATPAEQQKPDGSTQAPLATITEIDEAQPVNDAAAAVVLSDIELADDAVAVDPQAAVAETDLTASETNTTLTDIPVSETQTTLAIRESTGERPDTGRVEDDQGSRLANSNGAIIDAPADDEAYDADTTGNEPASTAAEINPTRKEYRWVTDIPGFETF